jgi:hypothetical protein
LVGDVERLAQHRPQLLHQELTLELPLEVGDGEAVGAQDLLVLVLADEGAGLVLEAGNLQDRLAQLGGADVEAHPLRFAHQDRLRDQPVERLHREPELLAELGRVVRAVHRLRLALALLVLAAEVLDRDGFAADGGGGGDRPARGGCIRRVRSPRRPAG